MNIIQAALIKFLSGLLYGFGFAVAVIIVAYFFVLDMAPKNTEAAPYPTTQAKASRPELLPRPKKYDETANLRVSITREIIGNDEFTLLGNIENNGDSAWSGIHLNAELFNKNGEFIDQCRAYVNQTSNPGSIINFKLSCGSCSRFSTDDYDSYTLAITNALLSR